MDLDKHDQFNRLDTTGLIQNINEFPGQFEMSVDEAQNVSIPTHFIQTSEVVLLGNHSNYHINLLLQEVTKQGKVPVHVWNRPGIPGFLSNKTLVVASSYSGDNESTVKSFDLAAQRGAKLIAITTGGMLASLSRKYKSPYFEIQYGSPSRVAFGYIFGGLLATFQKIGLVDISAQEFKRITAELNSSQKQLVPELTTSKNIAKQIALSLRNKIMLGVGGDHLLPAALHFAYQLNHSARMLSFATSMQDFYSNLLLGMMYPPKVNDRLKMVFFESSYQNGLSSEEYEKLSQACKRYGITPEKLELSSSSYISEALQFIMLGDFISYYTAIYSDIDPEMSKINK